jgi:hypothetical protein
MTGVRGVIGGTFGTVLGAVENGRGTSGVEPDATGAADVKEVSIGFSTRFNDGTRTGDAEFERDGV